jgi:hypothetical protein
VPSVPFNMKCIGFDSFSSPERVILPAAEACMISYKIGPSIAMVLFQSRRVIGHWATVSAVTGWEQAR